MKRGAYRTIIFVGIGLLTGTASLQAQNQVQLVGQNTLIQQSAPPPATLQATGTAQSFNLLTNRADVQDTLKAVFDQAQKQFTLDAGVTGQVTLRLVNQPLVRVLEAICRQTYLKYQIQNGVFVFSRDEDAVRRAIMQLRELNVQLREQLRGMGLDMPAEATFYMLNGAQNNAGGFGGGAGTANGAFGRSQSGVYPNNGVRRLQLPNGMTPEQFAELRGGGRPGGSPSDIKAALPKRNVMAQKEERGRELDAEGAAKKDSLIGNAPNSNAGGVNGGVQFNADAYGALLKDNGLYGVNTGGAQVPVSDVLTELGRQAGITVLLDPDIPKDARFRMRAKLPPRTLEETLNFIATGAHLELRRAGNTIIVSPAPDFQVFFGMDTQPRVSIGTAQNSQRAKTQEPATSKDARKETEDKSKSAPEKPKDNPEKGKGKPVSD